MSLTREEIKERVVQEYDPDLLVEVLEITSEELLEFFMDRVIERLDKFDLEEV